MESLKNKWQLYTKKNDKLEKEKEKLKDQVQENNFFVVSAVRQEKSSSELLNCAQELLVMAHQQQYKGKPEMNRSWTVAAAEVLVRLHTLANPLTPPALANPDPATLAPASPANPLPPPAPTNPCPCP
ncbi:putative replication endonuclease from prophage-like region [Bienertia sinuspersici]